MGTLQGVSETALPRTRAGARRRCASASPGSPPHLGDPNFQNFPEGPSREGPAPRPPGQGGRCPRHGEGQGPARGHTAPPGPAAQLAALRGLAQQGRAGPPGGPRPPSHGMKGESAETCLPPRLARPFRNRIWLGAPGFDVGAAAPAPGRLGSLREADLKGQPRPSAAFPGPARRRRRGGGWGAREASSPVQRARGRAVLGVQGPARGCPASATRCHASTRPLGSYRIAVVPRYCPISGPSTSRSSCQKHPSCL